MYVIPIYHLWNHEYVQPIIQWFVTDLDVVVSVSKVKNLNGM